MTMTSSTVRTIWEESQLEAAGRYLATLKHLSHPAAAERGRMLSSQLAQGMSPPAALLHIGAPTWIATLLAEAEPSDLPSALGSIATVAGRAAHRRARLRAAAVYSLAVLSVALAAALAVGGGLMPSMSKMFSQTSGLAVGFLVAGIAIALMAMVTLTLLRSAPTVPFRSFREAHESARLLGLASALHSAGAALPDSLFAAAGASNSHRVSDGAKQTAEALRRGEPIPGSALLPPLEAALFGTAAARGAGEPVLSALAEAHEVRAAHGTRVAVFRVELFSMLACALAILIIGGALLHSYLSAIVAGT